MKLLKFKLEIIDPLLDLNREIKISVPSLNPSPHTVCQAVFSVFRAGKQLSAGFSFLLFGNPFEPYRNIDLEFCMGLMKNPCCFPFF